jgi:hypothetical protein
MELERIKRYKDKIEHIREGIGDIKSWANVYEDFVSDKKNAAGDLQGLPRGIGGMC